MSDNCAFVRTELSLGPGNYGHDGVRRVIDDGEPHGHRHLALRAGRVDHARHQRRAPVRDGAGLLGDRGRRRAPPGRVRVEDRRPDRQGAVPAQRQAASGCSTPQVARSETQMLTEVLKNGTASGLSIGRPAAGKTGTTDDNQDAWFIGYTPQITTAVWMGDPNAETPMTNVGGISVFGATYPAAHLGRVHEGRARATCRRPTSSRPTRSCGREPRADRRAGPGLPLLLLPARRSRPPRPPVARPTVTTPPPTYPAPRAPTTPPPVTVPRTTPPTTPPTTARRPAATPTTGP